MEISLYSQVIKLFKVDGELVEIIPFREGHINETYLVTLNNHKQFILQCIADKIFNPIDKLMNNIVLVTEYCAKNIKRKGGDPNRETINIIYAKDNKPFVFYLNRYYRLMNYIDNSIAYQVVKEPKDFYNCALAFANFYKLLDGFDASKLYEIIPNFHNTEVRYQNFLNAANANKFNRVKDCEKEIKFIQDRKHYYSQIVNMLKNKQLPLKVTHNDTKLNNVLFDRTTNAPIAVIDLDTIMPGSLIYDFGDSIRFGCNPASEDEKDLSKVNFRFDLYKTFLEGFLKGLGDNITQIEKDNLALASIMMTIECGMRFLTDYLEGDHYFHIHREGQNLDRARTQLKLVSDMEKIIDKMNALVK